MSLYIMSNEVRKVLSHVLNKLKNKNFHWWQLETAAQQKGVLLWKKSLTVQNVSLKNLFSRHDDDDYVSDVVIFVF